MLHAMRGLEAREGDLAVKPWLYRIAHNESISLLRRRPQVDQLDAVDAGSGGGAEQDAEGRTRLRELVDDIQQLPERQRGALVMRELSGLRYAEVAAALSVSTDAAKQSVLEARRALVDFGKGRDMDCETVCRMVSDSDRRTLRGRALRAHLGACASCHEFETAIGTRRADLAASHPPFRPRPRPPYSRACQMVAAEAAGVWWRACWAAEASARRPASRWPSAP
ncbi:MAG: hypothetical protein AVDCRST_MAG45-2035 [uncultured Solirubrobacterales bacterium]|uniref:RNA polymerase sigma factor 70 region 4 type 2 domain-containing protein n=1 Tax=uncultured Solirubrobacterales bacterium TaxID=768556 RepID=A0A6J4T3K2_9ACTN|nr:MAG: hypothetical protein AVDCRST_MAG45-2035 [uncultured Solirubrobacterales bacterium]